MVHGLPDFPWDRIAQAGDIARSHPDGIVDLSVGTPVDATPDVIQDALVAHSNAPGYPTAIGLPELREAWAQWSARVLNAQLGPDNISPTIGSKEIVGWLPTILGLNSSNVIAIPELAYPTYAVGAQISKSRIVTYHRAEDIPADTSLIWVNTPSNPTGAVLSIDEMQAIVSRAREIGAIVVSDECYIELGWDCTPISILNADVNDGDLTNILSVHSLSKRSNLAGYRSGSIMGDSSLIKDIVGARKHTGMLLSTPVQHATIAALSDAAHVAAQRERYGKRRDLLHNALTSAGFRIDHSHAGLYLWATRGDDCMATVNWFATQGILVAPGDFYGPSGHQHVRVALTATDERVQAAVDRLRG